MVEFLKRFFSPKLGEARPYAPGRLGVPASESSSWTPPPPASSTASLKDQAENAQNHDVRPIQSIKHPLELITQDSIQFHGLLPSDLSGQHFHVETVLTMILGRQAKPLFILRGEQGQHCQMTVNPDAANGDHLAIARKIPNRELTSIFDPKNFYRLFEGVGQKLELLPIGEPAGMHGWTSTAYHLQVDAMPGQLRKEDCRQSLNRDQPAPSRTALSRTQSQSQTPPQKSGDMGFDYYRLMGDDGWRAMEVLVYDQGSYDLFFTIFLPLIRIERMWRTT